MNLKSTAELIDSDSPGVSQNAINEEQKEEKEKQDAFAEFRDSENQPFDKSIHVTDKEGNPVLSKNNRLKRKPGVKKQSTKLPFISQPDSPNYRETGRETVDIIVTIGKSLGGQEWEPIYIVDEKTKEVKVDEYRDLCDKFSKYYEQKGIQDFPPGVALSIAMLAYVGPRLFQPHTQSKLSKVKMWFKNKLNFKSKGKKENAAHSDNGDNGVGKDNSSKDISA